MLMLGSVHSLIRRHIAVPLENCENSAVWYIAVLLETLENLAVLHIAIPLERWER
jgi:hypothetical protein